MTAIDDPAVAAAQPRELLPIASARATWAELGHEIARLRGSTILALLVFIIAMAVARVGAYYAVVFPVALVYLCADLWFLRRFNQRIAAALSAHLGVPISTWGIPPVRSATQFDRAIEVSKGTGTTHEKSFFGGFIKIRRP